MTDNTGKIDYEIIIGEMGDTTRSALLNVYSFKRRYNFVSAFEGSVLESLSEYAKGLEYPSRLWLAKHGDETVGSISIFGRGEHEAQLRWFCVHPDYQNHGIGTSLFKTALAFCEEQGYKDVYLWTIDILTEAIHLYEKFGFVKVDYKDNYSWAGGRRLVDIKMIRGYEDKQ